MIIRMYPIGSLHSTSGRSYNRRNAPSGRYRLIADNHFVKNRRRSLQGKCKRM